MLSKESCFNSIKGTFYGIETGSVIGSRPRTPPRVLIVPFMELKQNSFFKCAASAVRLNRTFYGIETSAATNTGYRSAGLNRTFYGIETSEDKPLPCPDICLNRTFYGIETVSTTSISSMLKVLIVPFMELKLSFSAFNISVFMS